MQKIYASKANIYIVKNLACHLWVFTNLCR